ncbi:MAG: SCO1664 family protein [Caldilineales bacterium]|nr:SCO1664 family protein [Caldilineales bacterium]
MNAPLSPAPPLDATTALRLLREGVWEEQGVIPWSSNYAILLALRQDDQQGLAIYKPRRGERPLWDFPVGTLYLREVAAYLLSETLGWGIVPPTLLRAGPYGPGSWQIYIDSDPEKHFFTLYPDHAAAFRRIALFDLIANNADRKAGHCLLDGEGSIWSIDHGICFHAEPKLRTVIWEFAGEAIQEAWLHDLQRLHAALTPGEATQAAFLELLSPAEVEALRRRVEALLQTGRYPYPDPNRRNHPWPPI